MKPVSGFGRGFVAPQRASLSNPSPSKNAAPKLPPAPKNTAAQKDVPFNPASVRKMVASASAFSKGERVFHEKFGVGHIEAVNVVADSTMYTVDFGRQGKKAMDAAFARLKKF